MTVTLHDSVSNLDCVDSFVRDYLTIILSQPVHEFIPNIHTEIKALQIDSILLPITITEYHPDNSYVCSPFNHYFVYGLEEIELLENPILVNFLRGLIAPVKTPYQKSGFDKAVMVNNFLLSTNLWQNVSDKQIQAIINYLQERFPDYAILFRSVDEYSNPDLYQSFQNANCLKVFSRKIYFQELSQIHKKRDFKQDMRLYRRTDYEVMVDSDFQPEDFERITELYKLLYLDKYSLQNPQFSEQYLCAMWERGLMHFRAFRKDGRIDAVLAYYALGGTMTQPVFGYDTSLSQEIGLYRLLSTQVVLEGEANGYRIHNSAGVGKFKRLRGAVPVTEYNAVYIKHLHFHRQLLWLTIAKIMNHIALPIIDKHGF